MEKKHRRFRVVLPIAAVVVLLVAGVFYYIAGIQRSLWNQTVAEILEVTSQGNHAFEIYVNKDMQILNRIVKHLSVLDAGDEALITREIDSFEDGEVYFTVIVPDRSLMYSRGGQGARLRRRSGVCSPPSARPASESPIWTPIQGSGWWADTSGSPSRTAPKASSR